jgi:ABC-2 type transport system ATP-binding protein
MRYTQAFHPSWDRSYATSLLDTFGLDGALKVKDLSKGMRAQAGLVVAVAHRPDLLILDEPSSGLDAVVRQDILNAIVRTVADDGRTVLFSSHLLEEVERMSDHVTMIHEGRVALDGPLDEIRQAHQRCSVRLSERVTRAPRLEGALSLDGDGRSWSFVLDTPLDRFRESVARAGGEIVQAREATLEEIFVARVARGRKSAEAA